MQTLPIVIIPGILGIVPLFFIGFKDMFRQAGPLAGVYFGIAGLIFGLGVFETIRRFVLEFLENRLLRRKEGATRLKAIVLQDGLGASNSNPIALGEKNRTFISINYSYTDTHGRFMSKYTYKLYTPLEKQYLSDLGEFDIVVSGRLSAIAEDLSEQVIRDFYENKK